MKTNHNKKPVVLLGNPVNDAIFSTYWYWVKERRIMWEKRYMQNLPPPYTQDEILAKYSFLTTHRRWDRTTLWYFVNVISKLKTNQDKVFNTILFIWFNKVDTVKHVLPVRVADYNHWEVVETLQALYEDESVFTGAYMQSAHRSMVVPQREIKSGMYTEDNKLQRVLRLFHEDVYMNIEQLTKMCLNNDAKQVHRLLCDSVRGIGDFIVHEMVQALMSIGLVRDSDPAYISGGIGCKTFLKNLAGPLSPKEIAPLLREIHARQDELYFQYTESVLPEPLSLLDIESACCETYKYLFYQANVGIIAKRRNYKYAESTERTKDYMALFNKAKEKGFIV